MFKRFLLRIRDVKTIGKLIPGADEEARSLGKKTTGAEHFVLSALNLEDGTASKTFEKLGIDSIGFRNAVKAQYDVGLSTKGVDAGSLDDEPVPVHSDKASHSSKPSGQSLMKSLYALKQKDKERPLQGAHVLIAAAAIEHGVLPAALKVLGINRDALAKVASEELAST